MNLFDTTVGTGVFFILRKEILTSGILSSLSHPAKAVYIVLGCHTDRSGICFPSIKTICALSGISKRPVQEAIKELEESGLLDKNHMPANRYGYKNIYKLDIPSHRERNVTFISNYIVRSGVWRCLSRTSKSLYVALRLGGYMEPDMLMDIEEIDYQSEFDEYYNHREFDFCEIDRKQTPVMAGISQRSFYSSLDELEAYGLIDYIEDDEGNQLLQVFFKPKRIPDTDKLMEDIEKSLKKQFKKSKRKRRSVPKKPKHELKDVENKPSD